MSLTTILILAATIGPVEETQQTKYPDTRRDDVVETFHGTDVADPYRWLEADIRESEEVKEWAAAQNKVTQDFLQAIPQREAIEARLTKLWNYAKYSAPSQVGGKYFFSKNDGLQNQAVLYVATGLNAAPRVLIDPNTWSEDGTIALSAAVPSDDGNRLAYTASEAGSDWKTLRIMDIESGELLDDHLKWMRWGGVQWNKQGDGFYYGRYPEPEEGQKYQSLAINHMVYYHKLGTAQSEDQLIYKRPDQPKWSFSTTLTEDDRYLIIEIYKSTDDQNQVLYKDLTKPDSEFVELIGDFENQFWFIGNTDRLFYFLTDLDAPTKRIVAMDLSDPGREKVREVVAASEETLRGVSLINHQIVASYLKDAITVVRTFDLQGKLVRNVKFPGLGTASGFGGKQTDSETFYSFSSYTAPTSIYHYDLKTGVSTPWRSSDVDFDPELFVSTQVFYPSKDGTKVPMIITHRKDLELDGNRPTLLYGYGGFNISLTPQFSVSYVAWMEMGGVVAIPNLRGGGEYGEAWHSAGKTLKKQNVFDDFIAAGEWLIANKYTSSKRLAIRGGSNGGLLVGACMTQRPDLFGACLPAVGVMDMLRYQKFTAGRFWVDEYGTVDDEAQFGALIKYSPYHNLDRADYPATLVSTADTDDRVVPMHSFKFAAALQHAQSGPAPTLIRIESRAGHGAGTPTSKRIESAADHWAFLVKALDFELPAGFGEQ